MILSELDLWYFWLNVLVKLIESFVKFERVRKMVFLNMEDKRNWIVFDKLEEIISIFFLLIGSSKISGSFLVLLLIFFIFVYDIIILESVKSKVVVLNKLYELGLILKVLMRVLLRVYIFIFIKLNCFELLIFVSLSLVYVVNILL